MSYLLKHSQIFRLVPANLPTFRMPQSEPSVGERGVADIAIEKIMAHLEIAYLLKW